jgi:hypothetical protein
MIPIQRRKRERLRGGTTALALGLASVGLSILAGCAGTTVGIKSLEEPNAANVLVIGDVLVENINQGLEFSSWDYPSDVVIIGRGNDGVLRNYTVTTDERGYFILPNVPPGQYAMKAVTIPLFGAQPVKLVNPLDASGSEFFRVRHTERPIDMTAQALPFQAEGSILNFQITWFGLRQANIENISSESVGQILVLKSAEGLKNKRFWNQGSIYTREDPLTHFKTKFPASGWWKK